jgi:histidinol-phosphate aminotransferase
MNPNVIAAINQALPELSRYPDGSGFKLKAALSAKLGIKCKQITLGNGSNDLLEMIAHTFINAKSEVIFSQHAFAIYPIVTQAVGAKARVIPAKNYGHDLEAMLEAVNKKTRLVFIANPNNPTGTLLTPKALKAFIAALPKTVLCVLDEAYFEFVAVNKRANSIKWLAKFPNLIITRTFSKAYGLAGLRVGYSLSSPKIADLLNRVRQPFNNNALALVAAEAALADDHYLQLVINNNNQGISQFMSEFEKLDLKWIPPTGNFICVDFLSPAMTLYQSLLKTGIIVRPIGGIYELPNHLRISIGTEAENQYLIDAFEKLFRV